MLNAFNSNCVLRVTTIFKIVHYTALPAYMYFQVNPNSSQSCKNKNSELAQHYFRLLSALQQEQRPQQRTYANMQVKRTLGINKIDFPKTSRIILGEKTYIETAHSRLSACLLLHNLQIIAKGRLWEGESKWQR